MSVKYNLNVIEKEEYKVMISILPRTKELIYIPPKDKLEKKKWTFPISLFKDWK